jgi:hypothetical protein
MAGPGNTDARFACNINGLSLVERSEHRALAARVAHAVLVANELPDGYAFTLDTSRISTIDIVAWLALERRCCPFFDIGFEWRRNEGPLVLSLRGRDGVKDFIRDEFPDNFR